MATIAVNCSLPSLSPRNSFVSFVTTKVKHTRCTRPRRATRDPAYLRDRGVRVLGVPLSPDVCDPLELPPLRLRMDPE